MNERNESYESGDVPGECGKNTRYGDAAGALDDSCGEPPAGQDSEAAEAFASSDEATMAAAASNIATRLLIASAARSACSPGSDSLTFSMSLVSAKAFSNKK